jgi:hypothetical protein
MDFGELPPKLYPLPPQSDLEGLKRFLLSLLTATLFFGMHHPTARQRRRRSCIPVTPSRRLQLLPVAVATFCSSRARRDTRSCELLCQGTP